MSNSELYSSEKSSESWKGQLCSEESVPGWSYASHTTYLFLVIKRNSPVSPDSLKLPKVLFNLNTMGEKGRFKNHPNEWREGKKL